MSDFVCPASLNWSCILNSSSLPPPVFVAPVIPLVRLVAGGVATVAALAILFRRNPVLWLVDFVDRADPIPAIIVEVQPQGPAIQIRPIPVEEQREPERPQIRPYLAVAVDEPLADQQAPSIRIIWDTVKVAAAIDGLIGGYMRARNPSSGRQSTFFDSDSEYDSDASRWSSSADERYPSLDHLELEVGAVNFIFPNSMVDLDKMLRSLPEAQRQEAIRQACPRLIDVYENPLRHHVCAESLSDPDCLTDNSTKDRVLWLKSTAIVCRLIWKQLKGQNQQLYGELKEICFAEVAGQSMENLLNIASSFSDARWSASHIKYMFPIFGTLFEVLENMKDIPFNRSDTIQNKITAIYSKMVKTMSEILKDIVDDRDIRNETAVHAATDYLIHTLNFFHHNKDMLQSVFGFEDYTDQFHDDWVLKLEKEARRIFKNENDRQYMFILNNAWFVLQRLADPKIYLPVKLVNRVDSVFQKYKQIYLDEFWVPFLIYAVGKSSRRRFIKAFQTFCSSKRILKVLPEVGEKLEKAITELSVGENGIFSILFDELKEDEGSTRWFGLLKKRKSKTITIADFENWTKARFER